MVIVDALTTARVSRPVSRDASLSGFAAGQGDADMTQPISLKTAIFSFAFSGVLAPHRREYEAPRTTSQDAGKKK